MKIHYLFAKTNDTLYIRGFVLVHKGKEKNDLMLSRKVPNGNCFGRTTEAQSALKGIRRAPVGAIQEPLAPLITH